MDGIDQLCKDIDEGIHGIAYNSKGWDGLLGKVFSRKNIATFLVDGAAAVAWSIPVGGGVELLSGMSLPEIYHSRTNMSVANFLLGPVYSAYRDLGYSLTGTTDTSSPGQKRLIDTGSSLSFWLGVYAYNLRSSVQVSLWQQILTMGLMMIPMIGLARRYTIYNDWCRGLVGLEPATKRFAKDVEPATKP